MAAVCGTVVNQQLLTLILAVLKLYPKSCYYESRVTYFGENDQFFLKHGFLGACMEYSSHVAPFVGHFHVFIGGCWRR
jgi:hypothetical protein